MQRGFSMIEMTVVMAIMLLIAGISIPAITNVTRSEAASELAQFGAFSKKMLMKSVRTGEYLRIAINLDSGEYWAEKTDSPLYLMTGTEAAEYTAKNESLLKGFDESESSLKTGQFANTNGLMDMLMSGGAEEAQDPDRYNWENFVPDRRSIRELLKPAFESVSEHKKLPKSLKFAAFFAYHTPEIITAPKDDEKIMYIYIFPQGRVEPFYLGVGEKDAPEEADPLVHLSSDFYLDTKIAPGAFGEEVKEIQKLFEDKDEEGK